MFGEGRLLLDHPDFVADTWLNLASATWFLATPQPPKPSMLHVIDGTWQPNAQVRQGEGSAGAVCCSVQTGVSSQKIQKNLPKGDLLFL